METVLITNKAKWSFQEILPILISSAIGLGGIFLGITQALTLSGAIIMAVVGFGLALYVYAISSGRKKKSTLFAKMTDDKNLNIEVWMKKPIEDKWGGKLDKGKNTGKLARITSVKIETIRGTRVLSFKTLDGRPIWIPVRLAETDEVKEFIAKAVARRGGKLAFENKEQASEFAKLIAGAGKNLNEEVLDDDEEYIEENVKSETSITEENAEEFGYEPEEEVVFEKEQRHLDYSAYAQVSTSEAISIALNDVAEKEERERIEAEQNSFNIGSNINNIFSNNGEKITINLPTEKPTEK